ncbi:sensor histidine kinase [Nonomuraea sp. KM90]|uniref:sensor histidine kinase n=1 Tax=Nonomuraea sp. KM90 TaxID=3457428 RepID=UPI003FCCA429
MRLRNWRVRWRLVALIAIPTIAGVVVGGGQIVASISTAQQYQQVLQKADLSASITDLTHHLERERDHAVHYVAAGRRPQRGPALREQFGVVDTAAAKVKQSAAAITMEHGLSTWTITQQILGRLDEIQITRDTVLTSQLSTLPTLTKYSQIIATLQHIHEQVSHGVQDEPLTNRVRALTALVKAKDAASQQRGLLAGVASVGFFQSGELDALMAAHAQQESELIVFRSSATPAELQFYDDSVTGAPVDAAALYRVRALTQARDNIRLDLDPGSTADPDRWFTAITGGIDGMRTVDKRLTDSITVESRALEEAEFRHAVLVGAGIAILLIIVLTTTYVVVRSLVRPLRTLRTDALRIAGHYLPAIVRRLHETVGGPPPVIVPIGVDSHDEIGEVARAFDEVHREAVRLAGEESRLRSNVNAMFVNLSRRSQTLVERQITLIDGLEQGEQDEQRLGNLFKLDHLATRMRRNSENLLVLAGQEPPRRWTEPVKLIDVARASLSEVENYERIALQVPDGVSVAGQAVNDVIHLLAELFENALSFSPRETRVTVSGGLNDGGGVMLSITDSGIGMTQEELAQANERLTDAPSVDVSVSRRMGLFVVARLAHRHGIRVQLRPHEHSGLTAMVLIPDALLSISHVAIRPGAYHQATYTDPRMATAATPVGAGPSAPSISPAGSSFAEPQPHAPGTWPATPSGAVVDPAALPTPVPGQGGTPGTGDVWTRAPAAQPTARQQPMTWMSTDSPPAGPYDFAKPEETTGPVSLVTPRPGGEYLPIFAAAASAWFAREASDGSWGTGQTDEGWQAAQVVVEPAREGATAAGLPKRVPKANLVPGTATAQSVPKGVTPAVARSRETVRNRLADYQRGFRQARDNLAARSAQQTGPRDSEATS